jgi:Prokaryotic N-terminal methylation motif
VGAIEGPGHDPQRATRILRRESGYLLVEVMVAIMILTIAIIPMVGMFDAALRAAVASSNYDEARSLANEKLEGIRALPYERPGGAADSVVELYPPASPVVGTEDVFSYTVLTKFVDTDLSNPGDSPGKAQMRVEVEVEWEGNSYTTTGYVAGG